MRYPTIAEVKAELKRKQKIRRVQEKERVDAFLKDLLPATIGDFEAEVIDSATKKRWEKEVTKLLKKHSLIF